MTAVIPSLKAVMTDQALFAETFLRIMDNDKRLVPLRYNRIQQHYLKRATKRDLVLKSRKRGLSTAIQSLIFKRAITETVSALTIAHDTDSTQALRRISERFYDEFPEAFPKPLRDLSNDTITTYPDTRSECIVVTAGRRTAGRSLTPTLAHLSEVAFWNDADRVMTGLLQAIPLQGTAICESTPNGQSGWFYDTCMEALDHRNGWTLHFYPWWWGEDNRIPLERDEVLDTNEEEAYLMDMHDLTAPQIKWRRVKQQELKGDFLQEHPEDPISCFISQDGTAVFRNVRSVAVGQTFFDTTTDTGLAAARIYRKANPAKRFVMGLDFGRENDYTPPLIMDIDTWEVVACERFRHLDWHLQRARIATLYDVFGCEFVIAESNSIGGPNISELQRTQMIVRPFTTTQKTKKMIIDNLTLAIEQGDLILPTAPTNNKNDIRSILLSELIAYKITKLASGDYRYEAPAGLHDDTVMSLAFALYGCKLSGARGVSS